MNILETITAEFKLKPWQTENTVKLWLSALDGSLNSYSKDNEALPFE